MTPAPLTHAPLVVQAHAFAALTAFLLGCLQVAAPKGTLPHRTRGWFWVTLMALVALSSFRINTIRHSAASRSFICCRLEHCCCCRSRCCTHGITG